METIQLDYNWVAVNAAIELDQNLLGETTKYNYLKGLNKIIRDFTRDLKEIQFPADFTFAKEILERYTNKSLPEETKTNELIQKFETEITIPLEEFLRTEKESLKKICLSISHTKYPTYSPNTKYKLSA